MLRHILHQTRHFTTTLPFKSSSSFKPSPSPPRLPKEDQETFESLTKASMGAFSTSHLQSPSPNTNTNTTSQSTTNTSNNNKNTMTMKAEDLLSELKHKDLLTGGEKPLFEGERNPVTGEVGGPKTEPTKYGDWSFNGRVTDF
ncbi:putative mitochondrial protein, conserved [Orbilia oligospora]|uniref:Succinate dehydrogenase assembly factor 4, mitochondrial n=1 Tax=Orbilia oligospora TaxID=2813651 RepID=A0A7C8P877_ORBOL|nr:putative mitochondrial protein, conserved [Orbilia oligospora]